jgi:hypothetical protein
VCADVCVSVRVRVSQWVCGVVMSVCLSLECMGCACMNDGVIVPSNSVFTVLFFFRIF